MAELDKHRFNEKISEWKKKAKKRKINKTDVINRRDHAGWWGTIDRPVDLNTDHKFIISTNM